MTAHLMRIITTAVTTMVGVVFLAWTFISPELSTLFLGVQVILLPAIYVISHEFIENTLQKKYSRIISSITQETQHLNRKVFILQNRLYTKRGAK